MDNKTITVNGVEYTQTDTIKGRTPEELDGMPYVVIRSADSGAHIGYLKRRDGNEVELVSARRLWYWSGAATLSQLALSGVSRPDECKFPEPVDITVIGVCEVIPATQEAKESIAGVEQWVE